MQNTMKNMRIDNTRRRMPMEAIGKGMSALLIAAIATAFLMANGMFYEALVVQLNDWVAGQTPIAWDASTFYR